MVTRSKPRQEKMVTRSKPRQEKMVTQTWSKSCQEKTVTLKSIYLISLEGFMSYYVSKKINILWSKNILVQRVD